MLKSIAKVVDAETWRPWRNGKIIELTPHEFNLLVYLMRQPGQVVMREMSAKEVWVKSNRAMP